MSLNELQFKGGAGNWRYKSLSTECDDVNGKEACGDF